MRHRSILFLLVLLCCVAVPALAASDQAPAFVRTAVTAPLEGREPLRVIFAPNEAACRKAYGDDWGVRCAAAPGQDGAVVSGVRLSPDIPGEWRWSGGDTMEFRPKNPWPESTAYTLSLAKLPLPSRMKLASPSLSFSTPPLAVLEMDGRLWIDPDLNGERAVSFDVRFTTQPDRQTVQRDAALKVSDKSLMLAKPEFVWGENGTCLIKSRILSLAKTPATVTLSLPGVAAEVRRDGTHWKIPKGKMEARQQVTAPGTSSLFRIKSASLETSRDASLAGEYRLTVETSLLVRPDAFAKAVTALQLPRALEEGAVEPTPWTKAPVVDETVLNRAKPVKIEPLQPADQPAGTLRFRVPVPSDSYLFLNLPQGFGPSPAFSLAAGVAQFDPQVSAAALCKGIGQIQDLRLGKIGMVAQHRNEVVDRFRAVYGIVDDHPPIRVDDIVAGIALKGRAVQQSHHRIIIIRDGNGIVGKAPVAALRFGTDERQHLGLAGQRRVHDDILIVSELFVQIGLQAKIAGLPGHGHVVAVIGKKVEFGKPSLLLCRPDIRLYFGLIRGSFQKAVVQMQVAHIFAHQLFQHIIGFMQHLFQMRGTFLIDGLGHKRDVPNAETRYQQDQKKDGGNREPLLPGMAVSFGFVLFVFHPAHLSVM